MTKLLSLLISKQIR